MDLDQIRARVRQDLHDEDSNSYRWTDAELDRHIDHAVKDLSMAVPLEAKTELITSQGSRELSLAELEGLISIEAVEYPAGQYPPSYISYAVWGNTLTLHVDQVPEEGQAVNIFYGKLHTLNESSSTVPAYLEDLVITGASAYSALEWSSFATNRVNLGGSDVWRQYLTWGQERLSAFALGLARHSRKNAVRTRLLYRSGDEGFSNGNLRHRL